MLERGPGCPRTWAATDIELDKSYINKCICPMCQIRAHKKRTEKSLITIMSIYHSGANFSSNALDSISIVIPIPIAFPKTIPISSPFNKPVNPYITPFQSQAVTKTSPNIPIGGLGSQKPSSPQANILNIPAQSSLQRPAMGDSPR